MFGYSMETVMAVAWALLGAFIMNFVWYYLHKFLAYRQERRIRQEYQLNIPMTMEEIDADKKVLQARHEVQLAAIQTRMAEIKLQEAEALAKVDESLSRIDILNRQIELFYLESAAKKVRTRLEDPSTTETQ
jgi:hypothetical protein